VSQSPLGTETAVDGDYIRGFQQLAANIREGASFSGRERNCAFLNLDGKSFADASAALGLDLQQDSRGLAVCDWDHDGDLDLWLTNRTAPRLQFMQNQAAARDNKSIGFLLVGDPAKACPRDAAGARAVVMVAGSERTQTVHLGDGFVSQSSRWLHFGLGENETIETTVVHWPGGQAEKFKGVDRAGRFMLKQGTGSAERQLSEPIAALEVKRAKIPPPTETSRIWLSEPTSLAGDVPLPSLAGGGPMIWSLWASWCAPCMAELKLFGAASDLPILPINVENTDGSENISLGKAAALLKGAGITTGGIFASSDLIDTLNKAVRSKIYRHPNLPLPASFLLDDELRIRAIYRGPVSVATLRSDLARLDQQVKENPDDSVPMPGRWATRHFDTRPMAVAASHREGNYNDDAREYLEKTLQAADGEDANADLRRADIHLSLGSLDLAEGKAEAAVEHFQDAIAANPQMLSAKIQLVLALAKLDRGDEAMKIVNRLKAPAPGNPNFVNLEADVRRALGEDATAAALYRKVLAINSRYIPAIVELAKLLATSSDPGVRKGAKAVEIAEFLSAAPGARKNPEFVTTLADAYAEAGEFPKAVATAKRALALVMPYGDDQRISVQRERVTLFEEKKPFHAKTEN
jgi:tetratricopeptide (TPR) repeat protein